MDARAYATYIEAKARLMIEGLNGSADANDNDRVDVLEPRETDIEF